MGEKTSQVMFQQIHQSTIIDYIHLFFAVKIYFQMSNNINSRYFILEAKLKSQGKKVWSNQPD